MHYPLLLEPIVSKFGTSARKKFGVGWPRKIRQVHIHTKDNQKCPNLEIYNLYKEQRKL